MNIRTIVITSFILLAGCAVNRVDEVTTKEDADSFYKVPLVYGIGVKEGSLPISFPAAFAEYDPETKKGTSSCLGTADTIWLSFATLGQPTPQDHQLHYHVKMVPPGYYALMGMGVLYEANPSLYIKIEKDIPQYLGDFWFTTQPVDIHKHHYGNAVAAPVEYHPDQAMKALQAFDISADNLKQVPLIPTDGIAPLILCGP